MSLWLISVQGPAGVQGQFESQETAFIVGSKSAEDVFLLSGTGVAARHARVEIRSDALLVEDLAGEAAGGTWVNEHPVLGAVEAGYPATLRVGEVTLTIELHPNVSPPAAADVDATPRSAAVPTPESLAETIPVPLDRRRPVAKLEVDLSMDPPRQGKSPASTGATVPGADEAPLEGRYALVREIARGGMGKIYFSEDPQLEREVAVKVSTIAAGGEDPRFAKEAKVLAQLAHPNIVPVYARGTDGQGRPYYSMKLIKGRTLQAVLHAIREGDAAAVREYSRATLLTIFRKVCDAMAFAHSKRILHRDLKPENIMVGEYGEVLVMDWGLAKVLGEAEESAGARGAQDTGDYGMTLEGDLMGTPQYMSPEQAEGRVADLDLRSDIYSLGGILYAILTQRPPIEGKTLSEVLTKVKSGGISAMTRVQRNRAPRGDAQAPAAMGDGVPEALQAVTLKAMALDRDRRYASVEAFAADIEAYQNGFATAAENAGAMRQLVLFVKRHKGLSAAAAVFLVAVAVFVMRLEQEKNQARASEQRALVANETSRREAARARMTLAEAAEQASDSEGIRAALTGVPEDLRDENWEYLNGRSDSADLVISAPADSTWLMVDNCPDAPDWIVGIQSNGQLSLIQATTGEVIALWRAERTGFGLQGADVSADGKTIVLVWKKGNLFEFEVRGFRGGERVGSETAAIWNVPAGVGFNTRPLGKVFGKWLVVHRWSFQEGWQLEGWEMETGKKIWERPGIHAVEGGEDEKTLQVLNEKNQLETLSLEEGTALSATEMTFPGTDPAIPMRPCLKPKSKVLFSNQGNSVVKYHSSREKILWESRFESGKVLAINGGHAAPGFLGKSVCILFQKSSLGGLLEIRNQDSGELIRAHPFAAKFPWAGVFKIATSREAFACALPKRVLIWRNDVPRPKSGIAVLHGHIAARLLPPGQRMLYNRLSKDRNTNTLSLLDMSKGSVDSGIEYSKAVSGFEIGRVAGFSMDRSCTRFALTDRALFGMYRISEDKIWEVQSPRKLAGSSMFAFGVNPSGELLWLGNKVVRFSSGIEVSTLEMRSMEGVTIAGGLPWSGIWAGESHVVAPMTARVSTVSGEDEQRLLVRWNAQSGELEAQVPAPQIGCLAASTDGRWVVEGGKDKKVRIRSATTLEVEKELRTHEAGLCGVAWHPSLPILVTVARDGVVRLWNTETWKRLEEILVGSGERVLQISTDGKKLAVIHGSRLDLYEPKAFQN